MELHAVNIEQHVNKCRFVLSFKDSVELIGFHFVVCFKVNFNSGNGKFCTFNKMKKCIKMKTLPEKCPVLKFVLK